MMQTRWRQQPRSRATRKKLEFSKLVLLLVMATYFIGVAVGAVVVLCRAPETLGEFLAFIGAPTAVAIGFYAWKAKAENIQKYGFTDKAEGE